MVSTRVNSHGIAMVAEFEQGRGWVRVSQGEGEGEAPWCVPSGATESAWRHLGPEDKRMSWAKRKKSPLMADYRGQSHVQSTNFSR
jgi:hypothetical protein